jgi:hypothetical protein
LINGGGQCASSCSGQTAGVAAAAPKQQTISAPAVPAIPQQPAAPIPPPRPAIVSPPAQATSYREGPPQAAAAAKPVAPPPADPVEQSSDNVSSPGTSEVSGSSKYSTDSKRVARVHASGVTRTVSFVHGLNSLFRARGKEVTKMSIVFGKYFERE